MSQLYIFLEHEMEGTWEEAHMNHFGKQFRFCCPCNRIDLGISRPQHLALKYYSVWEALSLMTHLDLDLLRLMCHPCSIAQCHSPNRIPLKASTLFL